jgi:hypothetical protein
MPTPRIAPIPARVVAHNPSLLDKPVFAFISTFERTWSILYVKQTSAKPSWRRSKSEYLRAFKIAWVCS